MNESDHINAGNNRSRIVSRRDALLYGSGLISGLGLAFLYNRFGNVWENNQTLQVSKPTDVLLSQSRMVPTFTPTPQLEGFVAPASSPTPTETPIPTPTKEIDTLDKTMDGLVETLRNTGDEFLTFMAGNAEQFYSASIKPDGIPEVAQEAFPITFIYEKGGDTYPVYGYEWSESEYFYTENNRYTHPFFIPRLNRLTQLIFNFGGSQRDDETGKMMESLILAQLVSNVSTVIQIGEQYYDISRTMGYTLMDSNNNDLTDPVQQRSAGRSAFFIDLIDNKANAAQVVSFALPLFMIAQSYNDLKDKKGATGEERMLSLIQDAAHLLGFNTFLDVKIRDLKRQWIENETLMPPPEVVTAAFEEPVLSNAWLYFPEENNPSFPVGEIA